MSFISSWHSNKLATEHCSMLSAPEHRAKHVSVGEPSHRSDCHRHQTLKTLTASGSPRSSTSWLNSGISSIETISSVVPSGKSSCAARSKALLYDFLRKLPAKP